VQKEDPPSFYLDVNQKYFIIKYCIYSPKIDFLFVYEVFKQERLDFGASLKMPSGVLQRGS
jgi:hypothetical protein